MIYVVVKTTIRYTIKIILALCWGWKYKPRCRVYPGVLFSKTLRTDVHMQYSSDIYYQYAVRKAWYPNVVKTFSKEPTAGFCRFLKRQNNKTYTLAWLHPPMTVSHIDFQLKSRLAWLQSLLLTKNKITLNIALFLHRTNYPIHHSAQRLVFCQTWKEALLEDKPKKIYQLWKYSIISIWTMKQWVVFFLRETLSASLMIAFFNLQLEGFDRYKYSCKDTR